MTLASAQGNYTWAVMGDFNYFMAPQFCTVVQNVPTPEHPDLGANAMLISGEHRDFVVSNGKQQEHVHRDLLKAWDKKHTAVFVRISSCVSAGQHGDFSSEELSARVREVGSRRRRAARGLA